MGRFQRLEKSELPSKPQPGSGKRLQPNAYDPGHAPPVVHEVLSSPGYPLDPTARAFFETNFGHDFGRVRVHSDARAAESALAVGADAYTVRNHIVFAAGQYAQDTHGKRLLMHELTHVAQQEGNLGGIPQPAGGEAAIAESCDVDRSEIMREKPLVFQGMHLYRKPQTANPPAVQARVDVAVIVGRPSQTLERNETTEEKEQMGAWRAAATAIAPVVYEGLTVDKAFAGLKSMKQPIGKLYVIGHADVSGIGEVNAKGESVSTTVEDVTKRMKAATGELGARAPESVEMLACYGGGSPKTMARIGKAVGATTVRAPVQETVISGRTLTIRSGRNTVRLTKNNLRNYSNAQLIGFIRQTDALRNYDYVPGVPHTQPAPSEQDKLNALVAVLRKTGQIPLISYNESPGERNAVPYWKAPVERRKPTEELSDMDLLGSKGVIEVQVNEQTGSSQ